MRGWECGVSREIPVRLPPSPSGTQEIINVVPPRRIAAENECLTGVKFVAIIDARGRLLNSGATSTQGLKDADVKPIFKAMHTAYIRLLQNPFYDPDEHVPIGGKGGKRITSRRFEADMRRIGEGWGRGVAL
jgi:hypothetical protein